MRRDELLGLRRRDLDLDGARLRVRQQWARDGDAGPRFITLKTGTHAWRTIDLDDLTVTVLRRHLANQEFERRARGDGYRADLDLVFPRADGNPCDVDVTTRRFTRLARRCRACVHPIPQPARTRTPTLLLEAGESVKYVAERWGDGEQTVVETHAHVTPRMRSSAVSKVRGFLGSDPGPRDVAVVRPAVDSGAALRESPVSPPGFMEPLRVDGRA